MDPIVLIPITTVFAVGMYLGRNELLRHKLTCPVTGTLADVDVVERYGKRDQPDHVKACSLLPNEKRIECGQSCLNCLAG